MVQTSAAFSCCEPRNRADADAVALGEVARRLAIGDAPPRLRLLVRREDRLAPHADTFRLRNLPAFVGALDDPQALVLGHRRHHRHEAAPHGGFEVDIAAVENLARIMQRRDVSASVGGALW